MLNKIEINTDGVLKSGEREIKNRADFVMYCIGEYMPVCNKRKRVPAEIEFGPGGVKIYFWSEKTQTEIDEFV